MTSLDDPDIVMLDTGPAEALTILGERAPASTRRAYSRWRSGPAAFQVSFAVDGGIGWDYEPARRAGTLHLGGTLADTTHVERSIERGRLPELPYVLLGQQHVAAPSCAVGSVVPIDCYAHVPTGWSDGEAAHAAVVARIERYAPGFRDRVVATAVRGPAELFAENPAWVGGDIAAGLVAPLRLAFGARHALAVRDRRARRPPLLRRPPIRPRRPRAVRLARGRYGACGHLLVVHHFAQIDAARRLSHR